MKILFDQGTPEPLRHSLVGHEVHTALEMGWSELSNGDLLDAAAAQSFDCLVTTDQNLRYQQNLLGRSLAIVVLLTTSWPMIRKHVDQVQDVLSKLLPGTYQEIPFAS